MKSREISTVLLTASESLVLTCIWMFMNRLCSYMVWYDGVEAI